MTSAGTHSAADGFHDIKPLPEFHPLSMWWFAPLALALAVVLFRIWKRYRRDRPSRVIRHSPLELALAQFAELETRRAAHTLSVRDLASGVSLAIRQYLELRFRFPATQYTAAEVARTCPDIFAAALSQTPADGREAFVKSIRSLLRFLERVSFGDDTPHRFQLDTPELLQSAMDAVELVRALDRDYASEQALLAQRRELAAQISPDILARAEQGTAR